MKWRRIICIFVFHKWTRRPTPGDPSGFYLQCVRCGKLDEGPDVDPRLQGMF